MEAHGGGRVSGYYVSAVLVVAKTSHGTLRYFYQGATLSEDIPEDEVKRLFDEGFLAEKPDEADDSEDDEGPRDKWTVPKLKAYAEQHSIDLGDATKKADILAAIDKSGS